MHPIYDAYACTHANASQHTAWRPVHKYPLRLDGVQGIARGRATDHAAAATWLHLWGSFLSLVSHRNTKETHVTARHVTERHVTQKDSQILSQQTHAYVSLHYYQTHEYATSRHTHKHLYTPIKRARTHRVYSPGHV
jgi:hypothetical protein